MTVETDANLDPLDRPNALRELVEEWLNTGDNRMPDEIEHLVKERTDLASFRRSSYVKDYIHGALFFYIPLLREGSTLRRGRLDYLVKCEIGELGDDGDAFKSTRVEHPILDLSGEPGGEIQCPVLVRIGEIAQDGKRVTVVTIPSVVRLVTLDKSQSAWIDSWRNLHQAGSTLLGRGRLVNRELRPRMLDGGDETIRDHELPGQVVKDTSEVVDEVSDDQGEIARWLFGNDPILPSVQVRVVLEHNLARIGVQVFGDPPVEVGKVFFGPTQLRSDTI